MKIKEGLLNYLEFAMPAHSKNEAFARSTVSAFCAELDPTLEEIDDVKTAVSEAVTNAIVHGYGKNPEKVVYISVALYPQRVEIMVKDEGAGITDIPQAMQPFYTTKPEEERSGMGFTLMESFMNELDVESLAGGGTKVFMAKSIGEVC